jgi:hypothetical protein
VLTLPKLKISQQHTPNDQQSVEMSKHIILTKPDACENFPKLSASGAVHFTGIVLSEET